MDMVNVALKVDSIGQKGHIQVSNHVAVALKDKYQFEVCREIDVKEKSWMKTYFLKPNSKLIVILFFLNFRLYLLFFVKQNRKTVIFLEIMVYISGVDTG